MASHPGFLETEAAIIKKVCLPNQCVYAEQNGRCRIKYSNEAVTDFAGDGCQTAAQGDPSGINDSDDLLSWIIPGKMTREGFTPFSMAAITRADHQTGMKTVNRKVIYPSGK